MKFIADFHVHSKYSRATAKNLDLENIYIAGQLKGISVIGTGDFTHPEWFSEIKTKLEPDGVGLYKLKDEIERDCNRLVPKSCRKEVRFILVSEISNIYKKNNKTRKNHNLVFVPDISTAERFNSKLDKIGNIKSDGRPILGLDARDLLEILLETSQNNFLIPAHIWTPWFSLLGSKSGFDSIQECFEDLTEYIFAVETGLSSDPEMNWRVKSLDGLTLISNSDAHSPSKLGREANIFNTGRCFSDIKNTLSTGDSERFLGTFEFFPEEGKYHLDGHRKCNFHSWPGETIQKEGVCPVCGKPMTLGVLYRVEQLADRQEGKKPEKSHPYYSLVPLREVLSELLSVGPNSKKVNMAYHRLLEKFGSELEILYDIPSDSFQSADVPLLGEAIRRIRKKEINIQPGYDGEFGKITVFEPHEKTVLLGQKPLFAVNISLKSRKKNKGTPVLKKEKKNEKRENLSNSKQRGSLVLNSKQKETVFHQGGPLIIVAGPGTGKTLTITHRMAHLIKEKQVHWKNIIALTFTNKAAKEMIERLKKLLPNPKKIPATTTIHSFCMGVLEENHGRGKKIIIDDNERKYFINEAKKRVASAGTRVSTKTRELMDWIVKTKQTGCQPKELSINSEMAIQREFEAVYFAYQELIDLQGLWDYEDLIYDALELLKNDSQARRKIQNRYKYIFVDEYQDLNRGQYQIIKRMASPGDNICVIGDPDQSIYAFRGSDVRYFNRFKREYPDADVVHLSQNYRSTQIILDASQQMMHPKKKKEGYKKLHAARKGENKLHIIESDNEKHEAVIIGQKIERQIGGIGFHSLDFGKIDTGTHKKDRAFSDFAVLYRTTKQGELLAETFIKAGIPCQVASKAEKFYDQGIQAVISYLKILENKGSYIDFERINGIFKLGLGKKTLEIWKKWAFDNRYTLKRAIKNIQTFPVSELKRDQQILFDDFARKLTIMKKESHHLSVKEKIEYIHRMSQGNKKAKPSHTTEEHIKDFIQNAACYGDNTTRFFRELTLRVDTDIYQPESESVTLMTMHTSKGLEFPVVFIAGCEDGLIPYRRQNRDEIEEDEERRLFYVAMTRAKESLYLSFSNNRTIYGKKEKREPSPFLADIENRLLTFDKIEANKKHIKKHRQLNLF